MLSILNMMQHQFTAFSSIFLFPACVAPGHSIILHTEEHVVACLLFNLFWPLRIIIHLSITCTIQSRIHGEYFCFSAPGTLSNNCMVVPKAFLRIWNLDLDGLGTEPYSFREIIGLLYVKMFSQSLARNAWRWFSSPVTMSHEVECPIWEQFFIFFVARI